MDQSKTKMYLRISLLSVMFVSQLNTIAAVIMADLMHLFPDAGPTAVQMVMQFGMVGAFPVSLSVGFFAQKFRIKPIIVIGLISIVVGGAIPFGFHSSLIPLYIAAILIGAGQGTIAPLVSTLTLKNFFDQPRARQIGFNSAFATGGATIVTLLAGVIALQGWLNIYYIYFLAIPALILMLIFMPTGEKPVPVEKAEKAKAAVPPRVFVMAALMIIAYMGYVTFPINVGMVVDARGIGNPASVGLAISIITVIGAVFGFVFPYFVKLLKTYICGFATFFGMLGMILAGAASSMAMVYVAAVSFGLFFGSMVASDVYIVGRMCKPEQFGPSLSITMSFLTIGVILSPIVVNGITPLWGGVGSDGAFMTSTVIMGIAFVFSILWGTYVRKKFPEAKPVPAEAAPEAAQE